jgi:hypothetical protein
MPVQLKKLALHAKPQFRVGKNTKHVFFSTGPTKTIIITISLVITTAAMKNR